MTTAENLDRRHLGESQRALVAARLATLGEGRPGKKTGEISPFSQADAAARLNIDRKTVNAARRVLTKGTPELVRAVSAARTLDLPS
jgi:hypothetical protein